MKYLNDKPYIRNYLIRYAKEGDCSDGFDSYIDHIFVFLKLLYPNVENLQFEFYNFFDIRSRFAKDKEKIYLENIKSNVETFLKYLDNIIFK